MKAKHEFTTLQGAWEMFSQSCIPVEAGVRQRTCMKQSFWAGLAAMRFLMDEVAEVDEDAAVRRMADWELELMKYAAEQMAEATKDLAAAVKAQKS